MKSTAIATFALALSVGVGTTFAADPPPWAYGFETPPPPGATPPPPGPAAHGSGSAYRSRRHGAVLAPPRSPTVLVLPTGSPPEHPQIRRPSPCTASNRRCGRCGLCHYPGENGKGRAENAGVSGLSAEYFIHTMNDFKVGNRKSADPRKNNTNLMNQFAKNMSDDEIKTAAEYFGAMKWTPWIKVVETKTVPKTKPSNGLFIVEGNEMEPIGNRIVETPINGEATEILRDPHSSFTAYVPIGAVKKGEALVTKGGGKTIACGTCHGADLKGIGPVPPLAGRSPSYLTRQMFDMQQGFRSKGSYGRS